MNSETKVLILFLAVLVFIIVGGLFLDSQIKIEKEEITIATDKTEYEQGEEVKINIKNNTESEAFLTFPAIEVLEPTDKNFGGGEWKTIRTVWTECGVSGGLLYLPLSAEELYIYSWDQKEKWCVGENPWDTDVNFQKARTGIYRVKSAIVKRTKNAKEDPNNIFGQPTGNFLYSNEFTIKEESGEISEEEAIKIANQFLQQKCDVNFIGIEKAMTSRTLIYTAGKVCSGLGDYASKYSKIWTANYSLKSASEEDKNISIAVLVGLDGNFICGYAIDSRAAPGILNLDKVCGKKVVVATDKTEYEIGEPVKITIANHQDELIYLSPYDSFSSTYFISKFESDKWKRISQNCGCEYTCENGILMSCPQYVPPAPYFREFKSPLIGEWKQTQCASKNQMCGNKSYTAVIDEQVGPGKYKINFCYWDKKDIDLAKEVDYAPQDMKKCVEKEFTIKEKTAIDPRCSQKAKVAGYCSAIGFEFDSIEGKCVVVNGAGCIDKLPFSSLEECQRVCEISVGKELPFETIENVNWSGIGEKKNYVIKNKEDWQEIWANAGHSAIAPEIDFTKEMIIAAFYGVAATGGYNIEITKIIESADKLEVFVKETSPGKGCIVTQATTEPRHIIKLQKSDKEVIFKIENEVTVCDIPFRE